MNSKRVRKQSLFMRYMRGPVRILAQVRDLYVQSLTGCGGNISYGNAMGCPTPQMPTITRNFSVNSSQSNIRTAEEDLRELIRLASTRSFTDKVEAEFRRSKSSFPLGGGGVVASVARSNTNAFGRIDEDKPFEFGEEDNVGLLGRNRNHTVSRRVKLA